MAASLRAGGDGHPRGRPIGRRSSVRGALRLARPLRAKASRARPGAARRRGAEVGSGAALRGRSRHARRNGPSPAREVPRGALGPSAMKPLILSVLSRPPHPTRDGLAIRNYHLLGALASEFRVRAFALSDPGRAYAGQAPEGVSVEVIPQTTRSVRRALAAAGSLVSGESYSERLYRSEELEGRVKGAAAAE